MIIYLIGVGMALIMHIIFGAASTKRVTAREWLEDILSSMLSWLSVIFMVSYLLFYKPHVKIDKKP